MTSINPQINSLHTTYVRLSGRETRLEFGREALWAQFLAAHFTEADLTDVIRHLKFGINNGTRNPGALKFSNLIGQLDKFEEDLAEARAFGRSKPKNPERLAVLRMTGRDEPLGNTRHVSELLKSIPELNRQ